MAAEHVALTEAREIARACAACGVAAGRDIRRAVQAMPPAERAARARSLLKENNVRADAIGEEIAIRHIERLGRQLGIGIELIVEPVAGKTHAIATSRRAEIIHVYLDAVDGTIKVAGLGNDLARGRVRAANDGAWAAALAFTAPTRKGLAALAIGDFIVATLVDGNPAIHATYPQEVMAVPGLDGPETYELIASGERRLFTGTNENLAETMVYLDSFQAYDRQTRHAGHEELAVELYRRLINRHEGGAYDVLRHFGTLSALQRLMLGWREGAVWYESQCAGFVIVNENLPNLIPAVPLLAGAGGVSLDFAGRALRERMLSAGRASVIHAANPALAERLVAIVGEAGRG